MIHLVDPCDICGSWHMNFYCARCHMEFYHTALEMWLLENGIIGGHQCRM